MVMQDRRRSSSSILCLLSSRIVMVALVIVPCLLFVGSERRDFETAKGAGQPADRLVGLERRDFDTAKGAGQLADRQVGGLPPAQVLAEFDLLDTVFLPLTVRGD